MIIKKYIKLIFIYDNTLINICLLINYYYTSLLIHYKKIEFILIEK